MRWHGGHWEAGGRGERGRERGEREGEGREGGREGGTEKGEREGGLAGRMSITWRKAQRELNRSEVDGEVTRGNLKQIFCQNIYVKKREESHVCSKAPAADSEFILAGTLPAPTELTAALHLTKGEVLYDGWNSTEHNHEVSWVFLSIHSLDVAQDKITAKTSHSWREGGGNGKGGKRRKKVEWKQ